MLVARELYHNSIQLEEDASCSDAYTIGPLCQKLHRKTHMGTDGPLHGLEIVAFAWEVLDYMYV